MAVGGYYGIFAAFVKHVFGMTSPDSASASCRHRSAAFTPLECRSFHSPRWIPTSSAHSRWSGLKAPQGPLPWTDNSRMHRSRSGQWLRPCSPAAAWYDRLSKPNFPRAWNDAVRSFRRRVGL